jgi:hypothetical protein
VVLALLALYLAFRRGVPASTRAAKPTWASRSFADRHGHQYDYSYDMGLGIALSFGVGFLSSLLGIGGGVVHVPLLIQLLGFPAHIATATSHFILVISALTGTLIHLWQGDFQGGFGQTFFLSIGVVVGAQIGARLATKVHGLFIVRALSLALVLVGLRLVLHGAGVL